MGLERKAVLRAAPAHTVQYERRRPEETILHCLVREHLETFLAQVEAKTGTGLPEFVKDEFEAYLECGILAHGFLRLRCAGCGHEKLVAFSCKRRGFCPSCGARRMAESAARTWSIRSSRGCRSGNGCCRFRFRCAFFATHPELLTPLLRIVQRVITGFLRKEARLKGSAADAGSVTLIQRFGSAANLNIHLHCLVLEGIYRSTGDEALFHEARAPTRDALQGLLEKIVMRLMRLLTRRGYLVEEQGMTYLPTSLQLSLVAQGGLGFPRSR